MVAAGGEELGGAGKGLKETSAAAKFPPMHRTAPSPSKKDVLGPTSQEH